MRSMFFIFVLSGCFESIAPNTPDAAPVSGDAPLGRYTTTRDPDGTYTTIVDSTSMTEWVYGDFAHGAQVSATAPWDLRFQRFHISINGGSSGNGGVEIAAITGLTFAEVMSAPSQGWLTDKADGEDSNMDPDYAFEQGDGWYDYNPTTHALAPKPIVWAIKTHDSSTIKLEITKYYDGAGTAGWLTLHWSPM